MFFQPVAADLIIHHARIHTLDDAGTVAQAVAVQAGRFVAVGRDDEVLALAGPATQRMDLQGRTVIPGLFDSHNHLLEVGEKLSRIRLDECTSPEEMMALVRERAQQTPPGEWIVGMGWNEGIFADSRLPTRQDIDPATMEHPVLLMRFFNMDVANSYALRLAGIDQHTADPAGGRIERDADGRPNGLLRASAKLLVRQLIPPPTSEELQDWLRLACAAMHRFGITSVVEPGLGPTEVRAYQSCHRAGRLSVRVNLMPSWHGFDDSETTTQLDYRARELGLYSGFGDEWLRMGALKMAIDGGTTAHTAYMYEPFRGETEVVDYNRLSVDDLYRYFRTAQELGWDIGIHCCGDRAQDIAVETLARVAREIPRPDARHSIIHAYFPTERALDLMAEHHIAAVLQPTFIYYEGELLWRDVSERLVHWYKPARTYLDRGIVVTASSDVESTVSANPFPALYALVTRKNRLGQVIGPAQAISRLEALCAYTRGGTWLTREEQLKGSIEAGKLADLAVLDRDYFAVPEEEIPKIQVLMTIVGGRVVCQGF